jgi:hypothetical protein
MPMGYVYSFFGKGKRADQHLQSLHDQIMAWLDDDGYSYSDEFDTERGYHVVKLRRLKGFPIGIPMVLGDCLYNLRSVLDHLVFTLAEIYNQGPLSDEVARQTASRFSCARMSTEINLRA